MRKYLLQNASIDSIVDKCDELKANEELEVRGFGIKHDLTLYIKKTANTMQPLIKIILTLSPLALPKIKFGLMTQVTFMSPTERCTEN